MPNQALAQKTLDLIRANREAFDMGEWARLTYSGQEVWLAEGETELSCDTTLCAAGWASIASGYHIRLTNELEEDFDPRWDSVVSAYTSDGVVVDTFSVFPDAKQTD